VSSGVTVRHSDKNSTKRCTKDGCVESDEKADAAVKPKMLKANGGCQETVSRRKKEESVEEKKERARKVGGGLLIW
jgi:hypothetical protein